MDSGELDKRCSKTGFQGRGLGCYRNGRWRTCGISTELGLCHPVTHEAQRNFSAHQNPAPGAGWIDIGDCYIPSANRAPVQSTRGSRLMIPITPMPVGPVAPVGGLQP